MAGDVGVQYHFNAANDQYSLAPMGEGRRVNIVIIMCDILFLIYMCFTSM